MNLEEMSEVQDSMVIRETSKNMLVNLNKYRTIIDHIFSTVDLQHPLPIEAFTLRRKKKIPNPTSHSINCYPRI